MTLRRRLTIVVGLVVLVVSAVIASTVSIATRSVLIDRVDETLRSLAIRPMLRPGVDDPLPPADSFQPFGLVLFDADGRVVLQRAGGFVDDPEPLPDVSEVTVEDLRESRFVTLSAADGGGSVRALIRPTPGGFEMVTQSLESVESTTRQIVAISLFVSLLAALVGISAASLEMRRGFRPIDDMIDTAGAIGEGDLTRRTGPSESTTELGRLGTALDSMLDRIESAEHERLREAERLRRFVDDASHELRTPIAAITGYSELFSEGGVEPGPALDRAMARINEAGHRSERLIEDLLALARLDREIGMSRKRMDLAALAVDITEDLRLGTGRDIACAAHDPVVVDGDPVWLRQAIENLINNAVSHADSSLPIEVEVRRIGDEAQLAVIDHGPGIPAEERERVFDRFARPDAGRDRSHGGAGLGLAIVKEVVLSHGGEVAVAETPCGGATFTLSLPAVD
ncbi:MAG: HAMP domain-containing sensor histidine kinase [Acidimicrobiia bacterium]|nr:HAMP domain-containing sensor histidine kinase [Acidimicrobiia bacterium]